MFNPTTQLTDAEVETHAAIFGYARSLNLWGQGPRPVHPGAGGRDDLVHPERRLLGGKTIEQDPICSVQGHVVHEFLPGLWAALDATDYAGGGRTKIDGKAEDGLEHIRLGVTISIPVNRYNSIKLYGSKGVYSPSGSDFDALGIAWQVRWGGGL